MALVVDQLADGLRFAHSCQLWLRSLGAQLADTKTALSLGESSFALANLGFPTESMSI
jgi:hypothetical protein